MRCMGWMTSIFSMNGRRHLVRVFDQWVNGSVPFDARFHHIVEGGDPDPQLDEINALHEQKLKKHNAYCVVGTVSHIVEVLQEEMRHCAIVKGRYLGDEGDGS